MFSKCFSFLRSHWSWSCHRASSGVIVHAAFSRRESSVDIPPRRQRESYRGGEGGRFGSAPTLPHICAWKTASVPGSDSQAATASDWRLETYVEEKSPRRSTETSGNLSPRKQHPDSWVRARQRPLFTDGDYVIYSKKTWSLSLSTMQAGSRYQTQHFIRATRWLETFSWDIC